MDICVEVDPVRTLLVMGPQIAAQCLSESRSAADTTAGSSCSAHPPFLDYRRIVEAGIRRSLELENPSSSDASRKKEKLLWSAYELEPAFAANKVLESLKEHSEYHAWMKEISQSCTDYQFGPNPSPTLQYILNLRNKGARLVYTHYDDLLSRALGLPVVLMEDEEGTRKWSQGFPALLHIHGSFKSPQSIKIDSLCYKTQVGEGKSADILKEQFQSRAVVFIGFDEPLVDPLLPKTLSTFASPSTMPSSLPLLISSLPNPSSFSDCVTLKTSKLDLSVLLKISNTSLGVAPMNDVGHPVSIILTMTDSQTAQNVIDFLRHHQQSHSNSLVPKISEDGQVLSLEMNRSSFYHLWSKIFMPLLMSPSFGLVSVHLEGAYIVKVQQESRLIKNTSQAIYNSSGQLTVVNPSLWKQPISLPSPSSSISSVTGIPPLSVSMAAAAQQQLIKQHDKVRRIRSENDGLIYLEKKDPKKQRTNGHLTHQSSAPIFPFITSQGGLVQGSHINMGPPLFAVPTVHPMMFSMEQHKKTDPQTTSIQVASSDTQTHNNEPSDQQTGGEQQQHQYQPVENTTDNSSKDATKDEKQEKGFEKKRLKFIYEAKKWSRDLDERLGGGAKSPVTSSSSQTARSPLPNLETFRTNTTLSPSQLTSFPSHLNPTHSPVLANQKKLPTIFMGPNSQNTGVYTVLPPNSPMGTATAGGATGVLPTQVPILAAMQAFQTPNAHSPNESMPSNQVLPMSTPTFKSEQNLVYMLPDGNYIATPIANEKKLGMNTNEDVSKDCPPNRLMSRSPKRATSPNSDTEIMISMMPRKRRRSSSLPVANVKSPGESSGSSDTSESETPPPSSLLLSPSEYKPDPHVMATFSPDSHMMATFSRQIAATQSPSTVGGGIIGSGHTHLPPPNTAGLFFNHMIATPSTNDTTPRVSISHHYQQFGELVKMEAGDGSPTEEKVSTVDNDHVIAATPSSPADSKSQLHPVPVGRGPIQLWQFLLDLLISPDKTHMIQWTGNGYEFRIIQPEEIAKLWGARKNKPRMNYDKLSRGLRYYYSKGIMDKVPGKKLTFKYTCNIQQYMSQRSPADSSQVVAVSGSGSL